jgi:superfamily II DNA/RNA helicase
MAAYAWEANGRKPSRGPKTTGTVIFNPNDHVSNSFADCKLLSEDTRAVLTDKLGYKEFLPAQAQTFKGVSNGRDVILHSRTGSGKTLAYALPILERFLSEKAALSAETVAMSTPAAPYMLVFVFGNELAVQTKSVISAIYGDRVSVAVAGFDEVTAETPIDVLVGTLGNIDRLIRGGRAGGANTEAEEAAAAEDSDSDDDDSDDLVSMDGDDDNEETSGPAEVKAGKRARPATGKGEKQKNRGAKGHRVERTTVNVGVVSLARVRSIVIDEVDVTMGPKFSSIGRRVKNLLKVVRKSNGSLTAGLTSDYRMHHYVLCGATIPNWVIKAGFLGVKKYYYRLVTAGDAKVPPTLDCYTYMCPKPQRVATAGELIVHGDLGRTVIFTTGARVALVETGIKAAIAKAQAEAERGKTKKAAAAAVTNLPVMRTLAAEKDEAERIGCIEDFNGGLANVLLCTDAAARGLDFVAVDTVLMESVPDYVGATDTFVHRAGRTARVTNAGRCIWLADPEKDRQTIAKLESVLHIAFREYPRVGGGSTNNGGSGGNGGASTARLSLRVSGSLAPKAVSGGAPAAKVPTPREVLQKTVDAAKVRAVHDTDKPDRIEFEVLAADREAVRKALWKYDVRIL